MPIINSENDINLSQVCSLSIDYKKPVEHIVNYRRDFKFFGHIDKIYNKQTRKYYPNAVIACETEGNMYCEAGRNKKGMLVQLFYYFPLIQLTMSSGELYNIYFTNPKSLNEYLTNIKAHASFFKLEP